MVIKRKSPKHRPIHFSMYNISIPLWEPLLMTSKFTYTRSKGIKPVTERKSVLFSLEIQFARYKQYVIRLKPRVPTNLILRVFCEIFEITSWKGIWIQQMQGTFLLMRNKIKIPFMHFSTDINSNIVRTFSNDYQNYICRIARGDLNEPQRRKVSFVQFGITIKIAETICNEVRY
jgi:hypothetical protein